MFDWLIVERHPVPDSDTQRSGDEQNVDPFCR